ncbi:MAG: carbohydrate kinase [Clostridiales Family XIII bacterium]|jgi:fructokinase|nr:carbohydrate kinase [Clostridiales Family XIII bacterium]
MSEKYDIVSVGESLIDFLSSADGEEITLTGRAGGGPANMLASATRLGRRCCHISKVGDDAAGRFFIDALSRHGIGTEGILTDASGALTTLAIVSLDEAGERSFAFYREQTADIMLSADELDEGILAGCRILHFSTVSMTSEPARGANLRAACLARAAGARISFDPNYRAFLWKDESAAIRTMRDAMRLADYVKLSDEEAALLSGKDDPVAAAAALFEEYAPALLAVTLGAGGSMALSGGIFARMPSYDVDVVDTTGAGDGFWGAMLHRLLLREDAGAGGSGRIGAGAGAGAPEASDSPSGIDESELKDMLAYANAAGALAATKPGGIPAMPTDTEIRALYG